MEPRCPVLLFKSIVFAFALVWNTPSHGTGAETLTENSELKALFDQRVSKLANRQSMVTFVPCRPDAFPTLTIPGFCSDLTTLDTLCTELEISASTVGCSAFQGNFCCYRSLAQGNSLNGPITSTSAPAPPSTTATPSPAPAITTRPTPSTNPPTTTRSTAAPTIAPSAPPTATTTTAAPTSAPTPAPTTRAPATTTLSTQCSRQLDTSCPNVQQLILTLINNVRRQQKGANILKMQWDDKAAQVAQDWANRCQNIHGPDIRPTSLFNGSGQNIANGNGIQSWNRTFQLWDQEANLFTIGQSPCVDFELIGHFTQDVWATSFQIGCGFADCPNPVGNFFVCNYGPPGNSGDICSPYLFGNSANGGVCGKCGGLGSSTCDDGLCTNPCPFQNVYSNCDKPVPSNPILFPALIPDTRKCTAQPNDPWVVACQASCKCRDQGLVY